VGLQAICFVYYCPTVIARLSVEMGGVYRDAADKQRIHAQVQTKIALFACLIKANSCHLHFACLISLCMFDRECN
jgi:hypothetical protein